VGWLDPMVFVFAHRPGKNKQLCPCLGASEWWQTLE
jgi:hypothetical protein